MTVERMTGVVAHTITCPFCGLGCDDLGFVGDAVDTRSCPKAAAGFARAAAPARPHRVAGRAVELAEAAAEAAAILGRAAAPLVHGLAADLHGARALLALADRIGAAVDHVNSDSLLANANVARASGWVTATFGEIANRADLVVVIGADPAERFPRFHERLIDNAAPLYRGRPPTLGYVGVTGKAPPRVSSELDAGVPAEALLDALGALACLLRGREPREAAGIPLGSLARIAAALKAARYGAVVWDPASFAPGEAELGVELLASMLRRLNARTRCVGLPLGGSENALGAMQAALWQSGWPLRLRFARGGPQHDPWRFAGARLLEAGEADALLWVAALSASAPPATAAPVIALVADDVELESVPAVEIRVGVPGLDHAGEIVRADTVIALPLQAAQPSDRPSVAEAAGAILAALGPAS